MANDIISPAWEEYILRGGNITYDKVPALEKPDMYISSTYSPLVSESLMNLGIYLPTILDEIGDVDKKKNTSHKGARLCGYMYGPHYHTSS